MSASEKVVVQHLLVVEEKRNFNELMDGQEYYLKDIEELDESIRLWNMWKKNVCLCPS